MAGIPPARVSTTHDAMIDVLIAEPGISNNELAARFGYTAPWCSMIKSSDAFKARLAARRAELIDPVLAVTLQDKVAAVTERAVEVLAEKLAKPAAAISDTLAVQAATFGAKAMGLGTTPPALPEDESRLERLAKRLTELQAHPTPLTLEAEDAPFREIPQEAA